MDGIYEIIPFEIGSDRNLSRELFFSKRSFRSVFRFNKRIRTKRRNKKELMEDKMRPEQRGSKSKYYFPFRVAERLLRIVFFKRI